MQKGVSGVINSVGYPWKHEYSRLNHPPMSLMAEGPTTSCLVAAILNLDYMHAKLVVRRCSIVSSVLENVV